MALSGEQYLRYARHLTLPEFGEEGQEKLLNSSILLIGAHSVFPYCSPIVCCLIGCKTMYRRIR